MPKVEFRIAEPNSPYDKSTEILDDFNYERGKLAAQIEIASQSSVTNLSLFGLDCDSDLCNNYYILSSNPYSAGKGAGWTFPSLGYTIPLDDHNEWLPQSFLMPSCEMLIGLASPLVSWFDTGWHVSNVRMKESKAEE